MNNKNDAPEHTLNDGRLKCCMVFHAKTKRLWLMAAIRQKKILCGIEGENVVANGGLHSPARRRLNVCRDVQN